MSKQRKRRRQPTTAPQPMTSDERETIAVATTHIGVACLLQMSELPACRRLTRCTNLHSYTVLDALCRSEDASRAWATLSGWSDRP